MGPCLGTCVVVMSEGATGIKWVGARDAAPSPIVPKKPHSPQKMTGLSISRTGGDATLVLNWSAHNRISAEQGTQLLFRGQWSHG